MVNFLKNVFASLGKPKNEVSSRSTSRFVIRELHLDVQLHFDMQLHYVFPFTHELHMQRPTLT
jgi:hypothetical protein